MELEYTDKHRKRSKLYITVGLVVALIVGGLVFVALRFGNLSAQNEVEMREVVVALREIPARKPIEEGDVVMRSVPATARSSGTLMLTARRSGPLGSYSWPGSRIE